MTAVPAYELTLFVSGVSALSSRAIADTTLLLDLHLAGRYRLAVVNLSDDAATTLRDGVLAAPTLVKHLPLPARRHVGGMSPGDAVLRALDIPCATGDGLPSA
jgi:circadian clock protein KaiB